MLKGLKVGDRVMTSGGIVGTIVEGGEHSCWNRRPGQNIPGGIAGKIVVKEAGRRTRVSEGGHRAREASWASCSGSSGGRLTPPPCSVAGGGV
jgi:hypothetical protein